MSRILSTQVLAIGKSLCSVHFGLRHVARDDGGKYLYGEQDRAAVATLADLVGERGDTVGASHDLAIGWTRSTTIIGTILAYAKNH